MNYLNEGLKVSKGGPLTWASGNNLNGDWVNDEYGDKDEMRLRMMKLNDGD